MAVDVEDGRDFAARVAFPGQGLVVTAYRDDPPAPELARHKNIQDLAALDDAIRGVVDLSGTAFIETDMRAHRNPRRMQAIRRAMLDLVRKAFSPSPICGQAGFPVTERLPGLALVVCGLRVRRRPADLGRDRRSRRAWRLRPLRLPEKDTLP